MNSIRKVQKGWKIFKVSTTNEYYASCFTDNGHLILYKPSVRKYRRICDGALALFETEQHAKKFIHEKSRRTAPNFMINRVLLPVSYRPSKCNEMFVTEKNFNRTSVNRFGGTTPENTVFADWVKIINTKGGD